MKYIIYKITNKLDGKIYIGKHQTNDLEDGYMGSGKLLKRAIDKHGIENFTKEVLFELPNEEEMNQKEAELVNESFISREDTYNICPGGKGGFGYINSNNLTNKQLAYKNSTAALKRKWVEDVEWAQNQKKIMSERAKRMWAEGKFEKSKHKPRVFSKEARQKISAANKGKKLSGKNNPMFGKMWICNIETQQNKLIEKKDAIPFKWVQGKNKWLKKNEKICAKCNKKIRGETCSICKRKQKTYDKYKYYYEEYSKSNISLNEFAKQKNLNQSLLTMKFREYFPEYKEKSIQGTNFKIRSSFTG